jgi:ribokinase
VPVQDTTGAGDAFCGALAVRLMETGDLGEALRWANAAGGCAVTTPGAEPSLPRREAVLALLAEADRSLGV